MSDSSTPPRPRQVSLAAGLIMGGSIVVVLTVFDRISGLHSIETREGIQRFLSQSPGDQLGLSVSGARTVLRTLAMVAAGCATAAAILGFQVLRRSRSARLGLTVLAVPLFLTGMVAGGFMSSVVAVAAVMLWFQPAKDWFDGVTTKPAPERSAWGPPGPASRPPVPPPATPAPPTTRPHSLVWACLLTWVFSGLTILVMGVSGVVLAAGPDLVMDELYRQNPQLADQGIARDALVRTMYVTVAVTVVWSAIAIGLAALVWRGIGWARIALVASAGGGAALCIVASIGSLLMVLPAIACAVAFSLLLRPEVRAWSARVGSPRGPMRP